MNNTTITTPAAATVVDVLTAVEVVRYDIDEWCIKEARKASRFAAADETHSTLEEQPVNNPTEYAKQAQRALECVTRYNDACATNRMTGDLHGLLEELISEESANYFAEEYSRILAESTSVYTPPTQEQPMKTFPAQTPAHILIARYTGRAAGYIYRHREAILDTVLEGAAIAAVIAFTAVAAVALGVAWVVENAHKVPEVAETTAEKVTEVAKTVAVKAEKLFYSTAFYLLIGVGLTVAAAFLAKEVGKSIGNRVNWFFDTYIAGI